MSNTYNNGFKRPVPEKTYDRIFNADKKVRDYNIEQERKKGYIRRNNKPYRDSIGKMFEEQGKISRVPKVTAKPCDSNFQILSKEAKNNLSERYYYEINKTQW